MEEHIERDMEAVTKAEQKMTELQKEREQVFVFNWYNSRYVHVVDGLTDIRADGIFIIMLCVYLHFSFSQHCRELHVQDETFCMTSKIR